MTATALPSVAPSRATRHRPHAHHPPSRESTSPRETTLPRHELSGPDGAPLVIALGGISATAHVVATASDPTPGWWHPVVGDGGGVDTTRFRVLGVEFLDGGRGVDGRPGRAIDTHEQAGAIVALLDRLGVERAHAAIGASYGGMVALALAERFPERVERLAVISAAHEPHPMTTAIRAIQRQIVGLALDAGRGSDGLALARALAMTTYRSEREFAERFPGPPIDGSFPVEAYLAHCGARFAAAYPIERFLALSLSGDLHRVDPAAIRVPTTLVAAQGDRLVPESQLRELARRIAGPCRLHRVRTRFGHDAFLTEPRKIGRILASTLDAPLP